MHDILYEEESIWQFLFITLILGGWAAWMTGRAAAKSWDTLPRLIVYILLLACAVRFIHFALFEGTLLTLQYYLVDAVVLLVCGILGYRYTRTNQMVRQYHWLYERTSPIAWREKASGG